MHRMKEKEIQTERSTGIETVPEYSTGLIDESSSGLTTGKVGGATTTQKKNG